ncbi:MAG: A24 family peptidase [Planctomycetes bacterium]|nr:A24 family peptidase [Planctomycetota bacterium]
MHVWLQIPLEIRLILLFAAGVVVGGQVNRAVYRWAWNPRPIGPWSPPHEKAPPRRWSDRLPVIGWWGLRREVKLHGRGYWIRPMLLELGLGGVFVLLYWWEMQGRLYPPATPPPFPLHDLQVQYLSHVILITLMTIATFIDFDEKTIPDAVTVPGLLIGLALAALLPKSHLPVVQFPPLAAGPVFENLRLTSPAPWPAELNSETRWLAAAVALYLAWAIAVTPATWTKRRGVIKAWGYWGASMIRHRTIWRLAVLAAVGVPLVVGAWLAGGARWEAMLSSLVGMAFGGGLVWAVRIIAGASLGKEAMGFGDVTLMAMIGAYVGWQPSLFVFFLAPFLGILFALVQLIFTGRSDIAYGPYLCAATLCLFVGWGRIWTGWLDGIFAMGWFVPIALAVCLGLMGLMLMAIRVLKSLLFRDA